jgi:hypothetical protein
LSRDDHLQLAVGANRADVGTRLRHVLAGGHTDQRRLRRLGTDVCDGDGEGERGPVRGRVVDCRDLKIGAGVTDVVVRAAATELLRVRRRRKRREDRRTDKRDERLTQ